MKASEVMDPNPLTVQPDDTIECAARFIMENRYRSLPVVDENGCYVGMFGVNCLLKQVIPKAVFVHGLKNVSFIHETFDELYERFSEVKDEPLKICMSEDVIAISPDTPLTETMLQLYNTRLSIPVIEEGSCKLLGMISYFDIGEKILKVENQNNA
jgi:CBS-domain-containing membrane protein